MTESKSPLPLLAATFVPLIPVFFIYSNNAFYLIWWHMLLAALFLSVISCGFFLAMKALSKRGSSAFLLTLFFWVCFFSYMPIYNAILPFLERIGLGHSLLLPTFALVFIGIFFLVRHLDKRIRLSAAIPFLGIFVSVMLLTNIGLFAWNAITQSNHLQIAYESNIPNNIDNTLPSPDIYWIHCDGMLGFDAVEKYFDDPQQDFSKSLAARGFTVNRSARFEGNHSTVSAAPSLMCPNFYDAVLDDYFAEIHNAYMDGQQNYEKISFNTFSEALYYNEFIRGFQGKEDYSTIEIALPTYVFPPIADYYYNLYEYDAPYATNLDESAASVAKKEEFLRSFIDIMEQSTPLGALFTMFGRENLDPFYRQTANDFSYAAIGSPPDTDSLLLIPSEDKQTAKSIDTIREYETLLSALADTANAPSPKLCVAHSSLAHMPFLHNADGSLNSDGLRDVASYHQNHIYSSKVLINVVDIILDSNPNAIIVLQADHGIHEPSDEELKEGLGVSTKEDILEIRNSVMSAVRIPEEYGYLDEPLIPLNISRYLINNYVGNNYIYLREGDYLK